MMIEKYSLIRKAIFLDESLKELVMGSLDERFGGETKGHENSEVENLTRSG